MTNDNDNLIKNFIHGGRFPVYKYDNLKEITSKNSNWKVEKIPMFVDGVVVWTHFKITLKEGWNTEPYETDTDIRFTVLDGSVWLLIKYKGKSAGLILEAGDIAIIPQESSYQVLNQSKNSFCEYTLDANTLLEIEDK